ncbi:MAG: PaaX family transcriptional regulator C-terminal domain-containing protein [Bacteroidota bacterium]
MHRVGLEFFEIVREDPHLPMELLPEDWLGIKAALVFKKPAGRNHTYSESIYQSCFREMTFNYLVHQVYRRPPVPRPVCPSTII